MLAAFTQTGYFRDLVLSRLTTFVEDGTNGTLSVERLDGNFFTGFTLHNVKVTLKGSTDTTPLLRVGEVFTRYSIIDLLTADELPITSIILRSPDINFVKLEGDSLWNV